MGRQLPIVATWNDEVRLLRFIQSLSPIAPFVSFMSKREEVWRDDWEQRPILGFQYHVWLKVFPWIPEYAQTGGPDCPPASRGVWYVSNSDNAPIIEICRPLRESRSAGRVYWSRNFSAPEGLDYDEVAFSLYVTKIWSWIRRNSERTKQTDLELGAYFLTEAWMNYSK